MFEPSIVVFINSLLKGGAEKQAVLLANVLSENYKIYLVVFYGKDIDKKLFDLIKKDKVQLVLLSGNKIEKFFNFYQILKKYKINITFSYLATTNFYSALVGKLASVKYRIGGIRYSRISGKKLLIQRILHNFFLTYSIANSYSGKLNMVNSGFKDSKFFVIPNYIELKNADVFPNKINKENDNINIITVARFVPVKDHSTALKAIKMLIKKLGYNFPFKYLLVGYGELEKEIRQTVQELSLQNYVEIILNPDNINDYYNLADIYLSTSMFEGLSNSIMEAMEYSLPVVATEVGDNKELIIPGKNGFIVKVGDVEDISNKLVKLILDDELRIQMGLNSHRYIREKFSIDKFKQKYNLFIEDLIKGEKE